MKEFWKDIKEVGIKTIIAWLVVIGWGVAVSILAFFLTCRVAGFINSVLMWGLFILTVWAVKTVWDS